MIALHNAHAAEGFRQTPRHFCGDLWPRSKYRTDGGKSLVDAETKNEKHGERRYGHDRTNLHHDDQRNEGGEHTAGELH